MVVNFQIDFAKGHGTHNDFVIIDDPNNQRDLTEDQVRALCDRTGGIGADGVLRVVRTQHLIPHVPAAADSAATWFMDYRNADGSIAEMCGNGTRVFAHWLYRQGYETTNHFLIGTRAGDKAVIVAEADEHGRGPNNQQAIVSVEMGHAEVTGLSTAQVGREKLAGLAVDVGNPHLAVVVPGWEAKDIANLELEAPRLDDDFFPSGANLEIATPLVDGTTHMRVFERGVGETKSCGTGTVATACAALAETGKAEGTVRVVVPGGEVEVEIRADGATLTGPSRIVARGTFTIELNADNSMQNRSNEIGN